MNRVFLSLIVVIVFASVGLSGCTQQQQNAAMTPFVGNWQGTYTYGSQHTHVPANITFYANGTYSARLPPDLIDSGIWTVKGNILTKPLSGVQAQYTFVFSQNSTHLVLTNLTRPDEWNLTKRSSVY